MPVRITHKQGGREPEPDLLARFLRGDREASATISERIRSILSSLKLRTPIPEPLVRQVVDRTLVKLRRDPPARLTSLALFRVARDSYGIVYAVEHRRRRLFKSHQMLSIRRALLSHLRNAGTANATSISTSILAMRKSLNLLWKQRARHAASWVDAVSAVQIALSALSPDRWSTQISLTLRRTFYLLFDFVDEQKAGDIIVQLQASGLNPWAGIRVISEEDD